MRRQDILFMSVSEYKILWRRGFKLQEREWADVLVAPPFLQASVIAYRPLTAMC